MVPRTRTVQPRNTIIQTSGSKPSYSAASLIYVDPYCTVFKFPLEVFFEVFSYLSDHRHFIRENFYGGESRVWAERKHAERSVVIRRITMTCWPLRNRLLPLLWTDVEGCIWHTRFNNETKSGGLAANPYAQCAYLDSTPAIAAHVRCVCSCLLQLDLFYK